MLKSLFMYQRITQVWKIRKQRWILISLIIILLLGGGILALVKSNDPFSAYDIESVRMANIEEVVSVTGKVTPAKEAELSLRESGRIAEVNVKAGDRVSSGQ